MENIAIVIGVSKYSDAKNDLPGCKKDAIIINNILEKTNKFREILYINESEGSSKIKSLITNFIANNKDKQIGEFFFYYSGHGEFINDEFYYILSDFDVKKRNQTSIQNKEMDDLIRTLSPNLVIKFIDACQSGTTYVKEANAIKKYLDDSKTEFKKCYFLYSSLNDQASYQTEDLSVFTNSFINALKTHSNEEIRYKDIVDTISDEFIDNTTQTPFFVIQAEFIEQFCFFSKDLRDYLNSLNKESTLSAEKKEQSIVDLVKFDAKSYATKDQAIDVLENIKKSFASLNLNDINELFEVSIDSSQSYENIDAISRVGRWIKDNPNDYFATPKYSDVYDEDGNEHTIISSFNLNVQVPYNSIQINLISKYPNVGSYRSCIVFLLSKKHIRLFYFIAQFKEMSWDDRYISYSDIKWITTEYVLADNDSVLSGVNSIKAKITDTILSDLNEKLKPKPLISEISNTKTDTIQTEAKPKPNE